MTEIGQRRMLLLGLGNDILTDDAVGLRIARAVRHRLSDWPHLEVVECEEMGLALLDHIVGFGDLVLVDAVQTGKAPPGFLHEIGLNDLSILPSMTPHFFGIGEALELGRRLELRVPDRVRIFAVEVDDPFTLGTNLTPALAGALPAMVERIVAALQDLARTPAAGGV
jgi:hydrogenase maturation protease